VPAAYTIMPNWTSAWDVSNLAFAIVRIDYNKERGLTGMGNVTFDVSNSMTMPGDVLYDIMTNDKYGAGILPADIKAA
jgi:hypothetical protein